MKEILDLLPKVVAALSFAILALTVVHEQGYFWIVGSHFLAVASAYDYLSNSILWLPQSVLGVSVGWVLVVIVSRVFPRQDSSDGDDHEVGFKARKLKRLKARNTLIIVGAFFMVLGATSSILCHFLLRRSEVFPYAVCVALIYVALVFWLLIIFVEHTQRYSADQIFACAIVVPVLFILDFYVGAQQASDDIQKIANVYILTFKDAASTNSKVTSMGIQFLRSFDKGLLFRDPIRQEIGFARWDAVKSLMRISPASGNISAGCEEFPKLCGFPVIEP